MTFLDMTEARFSVRQFQDAAVDSAKLDAILQAVNRAPTAHNNQPQRIFVMRSPEALAAVDACTRGRFGAPIVFVLCYDRNESWKRKDGYDSGEVDCGIVGTHILYAALEQGLGSCWVAMFRPDGLRASLNLPENVVPVALIPVGIPAADAVPYLFHFEKKPLADTVIFR